MTFRNYNTKLNIKRDAVSVPDFLSVYHAVTGRVIPVKGRTEYLVEYRFDQDKDTGEWVGSKNSVYEQLKRNYGFDENLYPDFDALLRMSNNPTPTFVPSISPRSRVKPLTYDNNPYKTKENDMATTDPVANVPFKAIGTTESAPEKAAEESPAMKFLRDFVDKRKKASPDVKSGADAISDTAEGVVEEAESSEKRKYHRYAPGEDKLIMTATKGNFAEIAEKLGLTVAQVQSRRQRLIKDGLVAGSNTHRYTLEDDMLIISRKLPDREIAAKIGISVSKVQHRRSEIQRERELFTEEKLKKYHEELINGRSESHRYSFGEDCLILFSDVSEKTLAIRIGVTIRQIRRRKAKLQETQKIYSIDDLKQYHQNQVVYSDSELETASEAVKRLGLTREPLIKKVSRSFAMEKEASGGAEGAPEDAAKTAEKEPETKELVEEPEKVEKEPEKVEDGAKAGSLIDRMMDLMSDFETLVKETESKEFEVETKNRYEHLLKALIEKDLQFFALTAGDDKVGAQDRYLRAVGFTQEEIAYFRNNGKGGE